MDSYEELEDLKTLYDNEAESNYRSRICVGAMSLEKFSNQIEATYKTEKGSDKTNIINVRSGQTYDFPVAKASELHDNLEVCRKEGTTNHWSERQDKNKSGTMLDFDLIIESPNIPNIPDRFYNRISMALGKIFHDDFVWDEEFTEKLYIFFTMKTKTKPLPDGKGYKYGFHILIPGLMTTRAYKRWVINGKIKTNKIINKELKTLGIIGNVEECIDVNSAHVPVFFFGSCKRDSSPYVLGAAYAISIDGSDSESNMIEKLSDEDIKAMNLVAEMSILAPGKVVEKKLRALKPNVEAVAIDTTEVNTLPIQNELSLLNQNDIDSRIICDLLDILPPSYYTDYTKWRNVIFALASSSNAYLPIAKWFSQKNGRKWVAKNAKRIESIWNSAMVANENESGKLTLNSIYYWARTENYELFKEVVKGSCYNVLKSTVIIHDGTLQHYLVGKILHQMIGTKFCADKLPNGKVVWFEFVTPGDCMLPGEVWKWRAEESTPDSIHIYISEKLAEVAYKLLKEFEDRFQNARDENEAKAIANIMKIFKSSIRNLYNDTFKNSVIKQAQYPFRRRGFIEALDKNPKLFGVANGVIELGKKCKLIDYFHEYAISQFTKVIYTPFDPHAPTKWQKIALDAIADIIIEPDARDWILFHACQGLSSSEKESMLLFWEGGGQNGKTTFLRCVAKALGPKADKFNIQLLSSEREDADRPNSAMMKFKTANLMYSEESNPSQQLNTARLKELVNAGEISGRDLNSKQETFTMHCNFIVASQYSFIITTTDHGTWRRLLHYTSKVKFCANPNPDSPFEKKEDQRFVRDYPNNPEFQSAILSILVHYYERLENEYGGELKQVPCPTIMRETEIFRNGQDSLNRWICESIIISPDSQEQFALSVLADKYKHWFMSNVENKFTKSASDVIKEIESSALSKHLQIGLNRMLVLKGCRINSAQDELILEPNERMLSTKNVGSSNAVSSIEQVENWWIGAANNDSPVLRGAAAEEGLDLSALNDLLAT